jgi:hypothetical protein
MRPRKRRRDERLTERKENKKNNNSCKGGYLEASVSSLIS